MAIENLSSVTVDGDIAATGKVKGAQGTAQGEAVMLDSSGKVPNEKLRSDIPTSQITGLATVATSGSYVDLENKPIASTQVSIMEAD